MVTLESRLTHPDAALLHIVRPGDWFGTVLVLLAQSRRVTAVARTEVNFLWVQGDDLRALLRRRPEWFAELGRDVVHDMELVMQIAVDLMIRDASARCGAVLLRVAGRRWASGLDADLPSDIPALQGEFAMLCNVSRNTFSRIVSAFSSDGLVTFGYRSLTVNDPARLRVLVNAGRGHLVAGARGPSLRASSTDLPRRVHAPTVDGARTGPLHRDEERVLGPSRNLALVASERGRTGALVLSVRGPRSGPGRSTLSMR